MVVATVVLLAVCILLFWYFRRDPKWCEFVTTVNLLPGPATIPVLGNALQEMVPRNEYMELASRRIEEYGPIFRTWMANYAEVHLSRPEHIEVILGSTKYIGKAPMYLLLRPWLGRGLLTSAGSRWHKQRKLITPTFHFKVLETFCHTFVEKSEILAKKLEDQMLIYGDKGFDVYPFVTRCALDIICQTAMGIDMGTQEEFDSEYVQAVHEISRSIIERASKPWLHSPRIFPWTPTGKKFYHCLNILHGFTNKVVRNRKAENANYLKNSQPYTETYAGRRRLAFLDLLLEASETDPDLTDTDIREEVDTFMFEGHDTTTAAAAWALHLLATHSYVQEKVSEELDRVFNGSDRPITLRDLNAMKYLERVIKETLRLYPSVPFIARLLRDDAQCGAYKIPAGCIARVQIYHLHRCADQFPNPEVFDPDNFLPERAQGRHPYAYIPFSAGPRNCIGQKFAMLEEKAMLATLLRRFTLHPVKGRERVAMSNELILRPETGIHLVLRPHLALAETRSKKALDNSINTI